MSAIRLPSPASPLVSVVVVTYNAWEFTERCLRTLVEHTEPVYETIVVDNLSTDGTRDGLAALEGARVVLNDANHGFGAAACQGALFARSERLLFLNPDVELSPTWLPPLIETLDSSDDIAAVSPRLLNTDGTLQEAGSLVWGDGATDNYGDGDPDPFRPEYSFRRDVDYASGACLLVRRSAFTDAGGFDDAYHPAYYEDADLAMRWRRRGLRVVYEPRSTVSHRRWASSGDIGGMLGMLLRQRAVFLERWHNEIGTRPPRPGTPSREDFLAMRDTLCGERILVVGRLDEWGAEVAVALAARPWWRVTCDARDAGSFGAALQARGVEVAVEAPQRDDGARITLHRAGEALPEQADVVLCKDADALAQLRRSRPAVACASWDDGVGGVVQAAALAGA